MKNSHAPTLEAHEIIGFDEVPPRDFDFRAHLPTLVEAAPEAECWERTLQGFDEIPPEGYSEGARYLDPQERIAADENVVFDVLDEATEGGAETTQVLLAHLLAVNIPECEGLRLVSVWRQNHADPWIRAHDDQLEMWCK